MSEEPTRRVVVRRPRQHGAHHGGAWKVAYADFVTTMMALFIVLWLVGQSETLRQAIAEYFRSGGVMTTGAVSTPLPGGAGLLPAERGGGTPREDEKDTEDRMLKAAATKLEHAIESDTAVASLRDQIEIQMTPEGLRIELVERDTSPFFRVGSAVPAQPLAPVLANLQKVLGTLPNHITIEGHTDARQYAKQAYSNWELSTDRANVARRLMEADGLPPGQIDRIAGFADRLLRVPEDPLHASNRRISVLVRRQAHRSESASGTPPAVPSFTASSTVH